MARCAYQRCSIQTRPVALLHDPGYVALQPPGVGSMAVRRAYVAVRTFSPQSVVASVGAPNAAVAGMRALCDGAEVRYPLNTPAA
jgi:hypothetical protein